MSSNCGCKPAGKKQKLDATNSSYGSHYREKENMLVPSQRYLDSIPVSKVRTVRERVVEETSSNMMYRSTTYSKTVSQQVTYNYQAISQENARVPVAKSSNKKLRLPLTDVNDKYTTQGQQRSIYPSNMITSTARRPAALGISGVSSIAGVNATYTTQGQRSNYPSNMITSTARRAAPFDVSGASTIRSTASSQRYLPSTTAVRRYMPAPSSNSTQLSSASPRSQYSTFDESDISYPSIEEMRNVTLQSSTSSDGTIDDLRSFYSDLCGDETWLTCKTANEDEFMPVPYKENAKFLLPNKKQADYKQSPYSNSQIIHEGIPSSRRKTLKREVCQPSEYKGMVNIDPHSTKVHPLVLYSDYIIEIIENLLINQMKHILEPYFIANFNVHKYHRMAVVNWLVKLQQFLGSDPCVLFMAVRLFDKMLSITEIPSDLLQLVGLATYWISSKYSDIVDCSKASKLLKLCNNAYTVKELGRIENKVLRYLHFEIVVDEPIIFVRYYIYVMQLDDSNTVSICSNYLLDCLILDSECNTYPISLQAAAAVLLSLQLLNMDVRSWFILEAYPGYYSPEQLTIVKQKMFTSLYLVQDSNYIFREPYNKYATEKYASISLKIHNVIGDL